MRLTPPATATWLIAVVIGVIGILLHQHVVHWRLGIEAFWLVTVGFILLALAALVQGM